MKAERGKHSGFSGTDNRLRQLRQEESGALQFQWDG